MLYVYGLFKPSLALELGLETLKAEGFTGGKLLVVTLELASPGKQKLLDAMHDSDGMSLLDGVAIGAAVGMVLGVIYGSVMYIGPIALGLIGMAGGGGVGFLVDRGIRGKKVVSYAPPAGEVIVMAGFAREEEALRAEEIMRKYRAAALGRGPLHGTDGISGK